MRIRTSFRARWRKEAARIAAAGAGACSARSLFGFLLGVVGLFVAAVLIARRYSLESSLPLGFADRAVRAALPRDHFAAPFSVLAVDREKMIAGGVFVAVRRSADADGTPTAGIFLPPGPSSQTSASDDRGRAAKVRRLARRARARNAARVDQPPQITPQRAQRRMMDQHDAEQAARFVEQSRPSAASCRSPSRPVAMNGPVGTPVDSAISATLPRRRTNGKRSSAVVAAHVVAPDMPPAIGSTRADIDIVIAGNDGDVVRRAERCRARRARAAIFVGQREIDEIAGHRDVVGRCAFRSRVTRVENVRAVDVFALALPIDEAEAALAEELRKLAAATPYADRTDGRA